VRSLRVILRRKGTKGKKKGKGGTQKKGKSGAELGPQFRVD